MSVFEVLKFGSWSRGRSRKHDQSDIGTASVSRPPLDACERLPLHIDTITLAPSSWARQVSTEIAYCFPPADKIHPISYLTGAPSFISEVVKVFDPRRVLGHRDINDQRVVLA